MINPKLAEVGQWCFFEYKLSQIKEVDEQHGIHGITDGAIRCGGYHLEDRCFALNMTIKLISDTYHWYSDKIHSLKCNDLNHPDIHRFLVEEWADCCDHKNDNNYIQAKYDKLSKFYSEIEDTVRQKQSQVVDGVKIFGR